MLPSLAGKKRLRSYDDSLISGFLLVYPGGPFHVIYDHGYPLWVISKLGAPEKKLNLYIDEPLSFIDPSFFGSYRSYSGHENGIFIFPCGIARNMKVNSVNGRINDIMHVDRVGGFVKEFERSLFDYIAGTEDCRAVHNDRADDVEEERITLWIGVHGGKRPWIDQVDGYVNIIRELRKYFSSVCVLVDGITATFEGEVKSADDHDIFKNIAEQIGADPAVHLRSLVGKDYTEKVKASKAVDCSIANAGTGCLVPNRLARKPGVLHSNTLLFSFPDKYPDTVRMVEHRYIREEGVTQEVPPHKLGYRIPWEHIFNLLAEVLFISGKAQVDKITVPCMHHSVDPESAL